MINRENTNDTMNLHPTIGVLTDTEVLLVDIVQGKRVLRSILLPPGVSEPIGLLEHVWQSGLAEVWVMPATTLSRTVTSAWFEQANSHWVVVVFPEKAGWNWVLPDARSLLATVTYLDQTLARPVIDSPDLVAHRMLTDLTHDQPSPLG